ncbi:MFS general substrate transporter [Conidiobolus coronatus NRRL 28638]|uniref:MFS general substrate transporter n=1 Tax=Conidiobolus coronatus (strain ATCC 28846 / CBS 209.66 / NRRL 28638) TaxID=796925 RepID=A0A137NV16_CONC2|nr:MFS general substrate transporter [Conidiobolus coronatus NRRL 28638]|eukprot:KXN66444.1 MFS general substrate transporter [Conidiobolus coronatus NRRL 28638]
MAVKSAPTTPLLLNESNNSTPIPKLQFSILLSIRFCEPFAFNSLFPFVYFMVKSFNLTDDETKLGYYVGLIGSSFAISQTLTCLFWGKLSDKIGRKKVLLIGLLGSGISLTLFGLSKSLTWAILMRFISGLLNGNVSVIRTAATEITDNSNRSMAFSYMPLVMNLGYIFGAAIGGYLSDPVTKYPTLFQNNQFLKTYPYFLPCLISGLLNLGNAIVAYFFLEETLKNEKSLPSTLKNSQNLQNNEPSTSSSSTNNLIQNIKPKEFKLTSKTLTVILAFGLLTMAMVFNNELFILWSVTSIEKGGLNFNTNDISNILTSGGLILLIFQLYLFPKLQKRLGALKLYRYSFSIFIITCVLMPMLNLLTDYYTLMIIGLVLLNLVRAICLVMGSISLQLLLVDSNSDSSKLGTINGYNQTLANFCKSIGPILCGAAYSWSLSHSYYFPFNRYFSWVILIILSLTNCIISYYI